MNTSYNNINNIRRNILHGNAKSLWEAVAEAKDTHYDEIPDLMFKDGNKIDSAVRL